MAAAEPLVVVAVIAFLLAAAAAPLPGGGGGLPLPLLPADPTGAAGCRGPVGTCPAGDEAPPILGEASTMAVDHPVRARRVQHLRRDSVPCSRRGASYYNCRPGAPASPYSHACSRIKHCHG